MRLIYRHFFNVGDGINYVSKARRTMSESHGIRHDLGRCDRQRVREHFSFAPLRRKYESLLENFPSSAFALISIASAVMAAGTLTRQPLGNALLPNISSLVGEGNVDGARKLISKAHLLLAPCGGQGGASAERRQSALPNPRFIVTSLVREAVAAQELYETI